MGTPVVSAAVEGIVDDAVVRKLLAHSGGQVGTVYGRKGKSYLQQRIHGFGQAEGRLDQCRTEVAAEGNPAGHGPPFTQRSAGGAGLYVADDRIRDREMASGRCRQACGKPGPRYSLLEAAGGRCERGHRVYEHLLKAPTVRFLLADDAGAGKTIMAGLLIRELKLRGLIERILVVCPANLSFQWQREMREKFAEEVPGVQGKRHPKPVVPI